MFVSYKSGFTLIELLIVLLIFAGTATLGVYSLHFLDSSRITTELHMLHNTCLYLKHKAMACRENLFLFFDAKNNTYTFDGATHQLPACMQYNFLTGIMGPPSSAHHPISSAITFQHQKITFYPDGTVQAGTIYITDAQHTKQYALTCGVADIAFIRLYTHRNGWERI